MSRFTSLYPGGARCAFMAALDPNTHWASHCRGSLRSAFRAGRANAPLAGESGNVTDSAHVSSEVFDGEREDGAVLRGAQQLAVRLVGLGAVAGAQQRR